MLLVLLALPRAAAAAGFGTDLLEVGEGSVRAVRARDLTGDGRREIVAFSDGSGGPTISVFKADDMGAFAREPAAVLRPARHGLMGLYYCFLARLAPKSPVEVVLVDRKGVFATGLAKSDGEGLPSWSFRKPGRLAGAPQLPFLPDGGRISVLDAAADLDHDGAEELVLPNAEGGYWVHYPADEKRPPSLIRWRETHRLTAPAHRFMTLHWERPRAVVADWNGDGLLDLVGAGRGLMFFSLQKKGGGFTTVANPLAILEPDPEGAERNTLTLGDVNGDGKADLLLAQSPSAVEVLERFSSQQSLFLNPAVFSEKEPGRLAAPAVTWKTSGITVNPTLTDFDADGDLDLVLTSLEFDMTDRMLKKVTADYLLFLFDGEKRAFEREPCFKLSRPFPAEQLERNSTAPVCFFTGDFDGDGKRDLLNIEDDGHISILQGTSEPGFLSSDRYAFKREIFRAPARVENDVLILDLNSDGASDLLAHSEGRVYVIRSVR
jgi:hypothetical protein